MSATNNAPIIDEIRAIAAEQEKLFRSIASADLALKMRFQSFTKAINAKLALIDVPLVVRQPDSTPDVVEVPAPVVEKVLTPMQKRLAVPGSKIGPNAYQESFVAYRELKKVLSSFIKGEDREIVSITTSPDEQQLILNTFTNRQARMLMVFATNSAGWIMTEMDGVYTVSDSKYWKFNI